MIALLLGLSVLPHAGVYFGEVVEAEPVEFTQYVDEPRVERGDVGVRFAVEIDLCHAPERYRDFVLLYRGPGRGRWWIAEVIPADYGALAMFAARYAGAAGPRYGFLRRPRISVYRFDVIMHPGESEISAADVIKSGALTCMTMPVGYVETLN